MTKEKRKHKKKSSKRNKKTSRQKSSSDESSSTEEEWVELASHSTSTPELQEGREVKQEGPKDNTAKDDWLSSSVFASVSRDDIRQLKEKNKDKTKEDHKYMLDKLGQTDRELNPYWRDGGSGLPSESHVTVNSLKQASVTVGDQGAAWLRKALERAKEQAEEQGRSLENVVSERWGSLEKLESMIFAAEERDKKIQTYEKYEDKYKHKYDVQKFDKRKCSVPKEEKYSSKPERHDKNERHSKNEGNKKHFMNIIDRRKDFPNTEKVKSKNNSENEIANLYSKSDLEKDKSIKKSKYEMYKEETKKKKRYFSKPDSSSERSSEDSEREYNTTTNSSRKKRSERFFSLSDSNSNKEEKYGKQRSRENICKKFSKPSSSSSDDDDRRYKNKMTTNHDRVKNRRSSKERKNNSKRVFVKPHNDSGSDYFEREFEKDRSEKHGTSSSGKGWKKKAETESKGARSPDYNDTLDSNVRKEPNTIVEKTVKSEDIPVLTDKEMNDLGAKLLKAEMLGNDALVEELKTKLEEARKVKASSSNETKLSEEVVILTVTDSKGFTRPVSLGESSEPTGSRRKSKKVETHSGGKRMRYFADDDKYTLQEMFQREKLSTVEDSNEVFAKLASKGVGRDDSTRDMEDVFEETARMEEAEGKKERRDRRQAIEQSKRTARSLDNCQWCLESQNMLKHLIIAIGSSCYICVPPYQSLTDNHCLIVPTHHTPCATQLDEDVWREMQDFRKSVVRMFLSQDEDVVFFESARYLNRFPHMVLNCVPMPKETGDLAPIYFKKAIQECEMEWSNNKKLVELKGKDVRRAVPKGLPYFAVDFGMESGFAHVIEDEKLFPLNFAQEIIGGMLDLDHTIWRKQRKQTFEEQSKKVIQLTKLWSPFDNTKNK